MIVGTRTFGLIILVKIKKDKKPYALKGPDDYYAMQRKPRRRIEKVRSGLVTLSRAHPV